MLISAAEVTRFRQTGSWRELERLAQTICQRARENGGGFLGPILGGGTRLMLALDHRISHDIDLFVDSPGWLPYVSPRLQDDLESHVESYHEDSGHVKLQLSVGEIDFIAASPLLSTPDLWNPPATETGFSLQVPAETLAKKLFFRGWALTARDLYDWVALQCLGPADAIPHAEMATLLSAKLDGIQASLVRLREAPQARHAWGQIQGVYVFDLRKAILFAQAEIARYQTFLADRKQKSGAYCDKRLTLASPERSLLESLLAPSLAVRAIPEQETPLAPEPDSESVSPRS